jgi:hypothetical protein
VLDGQGRLLYAGRDGDDWTLERLDLRRGGREILARERDRTPEVPARITQRYPEDGGMPHLLVDGARVPAPDGVRLEAAGFVP